VARQLLAQSNAFRMKPMRIATVDRGNRVQIPADWAKELGLDRVARLEKTKDGILVAPLLEDGSWDALYRDKLVCNAAQPGRELSDLTEDDLLF
jgi:bifunctional DNA-binding transcriptional regulator/antitoxin component of YhaV-PrlF toxin-antitoxin module